MPEKKAKRRTGEKRDEQELRNRILAAAFGAFTDLGYAGTSTLEIATRAKVSKRELYALFSGKEEMLAEGIRRRAALMEVAPALPQAQDRKMLGEVLTAFGTRLMQEVSHPHVVAVFRLAIGQAARAPEIAQILNTAGREATKKAVAAYLAKAQNAGLLAKGGPIGLAAQF